MRAAAILLLFFGLAGCTHEIHWELTAMLEHECLKHGGVDRATVDHWDGTVELKCNDKTRLMLDVEGNRY